MFIRPVGAVVHPAEREPGRPLLRGLLARGAYVWDGGAVVPSAVGAGAGAGPAVPPLAWAAADAEAEAEVEAAPAPAPASPEPAGAGAGAGPVPGQHDLTDQLHRLAELAREGLLTPEEFGLAKSRLLKP